MHTTRKTIGSTVQDFTKAVSQYSAKLGEASDVTASRVVFPNGTRIEMCKSELPESETVSVILTELVR